MRFFVVVMLLLAVGVVSALFDHLVAELRRDLHETRSAVERLSERVEQVQRALRRDWREP